LSKNVNAIKQTNLDNGIIRLKVTDAFKDMEI